MKGGDTITQQPSPRRVVRKTSRRYRETRTLRGNFCWVNAPGNVQLLKKPVIMLQEVSELNGRTDLTVRQIAAVVDIETRIVYLWPCDQDDPDGFEATVTPSWIRVNLGPLLEEAKLALPVRHRERFRVNLAKESETPEGVPNALCFDLNKPEEVQVLPIRKKKSKGSGEAQAPGTGETAGEK